MYGWVGVDRHSSDIAALKERLIRQNGLVGLEAFEPNEIEDVKRVFYRDGFVLVKNALTSDQLSEAQNGSYRVISEIMALDAKRDGNRGSHRYSFGAASTSGHQLHNSEWAMLIDLPTVTPILEAIFESPDYICRGGGGDLGAGHRHRPEPHPALRQEGELLGDGRHGSLRAVLRDLL